MFLPEVGSLHGRQGLWQPYLSKPCHRIDINFRINLEFEGLRREGTGSVCLGFVFGLTVTFWLIPMLRYAAIVGLITYLNGLEGIFIDIAKLYCRPALRFCVSLGVCLLIDTI
jgi:hypothetical protein